MAAVLFDLDGTLLDHDAAAAEAIQSSVANQIHNLPFSLSEVASLWSDLQEESMNLYLQGELTFLQQRRRRVHALFAKLGWGTISDFEASHWFRQYLPRYEAAWRAFPDVQPMLSELGALAPNLQLGVVTNGSVDQQRLKLRVLGLSEVLPHVTASSEVGVAKPDMAIFAVACSALNLEANQVVYVGDRADIDAQAAINAGLHGIWLNRKGASGPDLPQITTLAHLPAKIQEFSSFSGG